MRDLGKLAIIGSSNLEVFAAHLTEVGTEHGLGIDPVLPAFGTARMELLQPATVSKLQQAMQGDQVATLIFERAEDLLGPLLRRPLNSDKAALENALSPLLQTLDMARQTLNGPILVASLVSFEPPSLGLSDRSTKEGTQALLARANQILETAAQALPDVTVLDTDEMLRDVGRNSAAPGEYWHLARLPFSENFGRHLARKTLGALMALRGMTARLIVLDMDNTLWGGVLGEDGLGGIEIGGAYPGSAYRAFHDALLALSDRGVALAVASKNDADLALDALGTHPEMGLRPSDLVAHRIDWNDKASNIASMLDELNLRPASCMFIDDNPIEREKVRVALPDVIVPEFPNAPAGLVHLLWDSPFLECLSLTESDLNRTAHYKVLAAERSARTQFEDLNAFYRDLEMKLRFEPLGDANRRRVQQLLNKTNQFNMTTRRHSSADLDRITAEGGQVFAVGVEDRNLPYELMGVVIMRRGDRMAADYAELTGSAEELWIDSFMLSCRILGRTVEQAIVGWLCEFAQKSGAQSLMAEVIETPRNTPARDVYRSCGLSGDQLNAGHSLWRWSTDSTPIAVPDYFEVAAEQAQMPPQPKSETPARAARNPLAMAAPNPLATSMPNPLAPNAPNPLALSAAQAAPAAHDTKDVDLREFFRDFFSLGEDIDLSKANMDNVPGWDSLAHVRLMISIERLLGTSLPPQAMFEVKTYADLERTCSAFE